MNGHTSPGAMSLLPDRDAFDGVRLPVSDPLVVNDNQDPNHMREIEVDAAGNVYVVNAYWLNESDVLWKYGSDGTLPGRIALTEPSTPVRVADPLALHVSANGQTLYLASGQYHSANTDSVVIYAFSTAGLRHFRILLSDWTSTTGVSSRLPAE